VTVRVTGDLRSILNQFLECCALAHKLGQLLVGCLTLAQTMFIFSKQFLKSASALLFKHLVNFALSKSVVISNHKVKLISCY
jgi:hypothetical protein